MFDRFQSEPYAMRRKPWFETEIICERCRLPADELRRVIELALWVCDKCWMEAMVLIEAEGEVVERKGPVMDASAARRGARLTRALFLTAGIRFPESPQTSFAVAAWAAPLQLAPRDSLNLRVGSLYCSSSQFVLLSSGVTIISLVIISLVTAAAGQAVEAGDHMHDTGFPKIIEWVRTLEVST